MKFALSAGLGAAAMMLVFSATAQETPGDDQGIGQQFHITVDSLPVPEDTTISPPARPVKIDRGSREPIVPEGFTQTLYISDFGAGR
jgi:hypothetical protein